MLLSFLLFTSIVLPHSYAHEEIEHDVKQFGHAEESENILFEQFLNMVQPFFNKNSCFSQGIRVPDQPTPGFLTMTFDDGPNPATTPIVLDVLKKHDVKATFFIEADNVARAGSLLDRMINEGHRIGSHSYSHPNFAKITLEQQKDEIDHASSILEGHRDPHSYFRFPYGSATCESVDYLKSQNSKIVGWHIDSCDWAYSDGKITDKERRICGVAKGEENDFIGHALRMARVAKGGIVLMHDVHHLTANHLDELLSEFEKAGNHFVDLGDSQLYPKLNGSN
jgi:peptidoglycan/xylan/chitin deacetylase (PgdA/CDA1 family)